MIGKLKSISVTDISEGMQVLVDGYDAIFTILSLDMMAGEARITCKESGNIIIDISDLRTLVVEYEKHVKGLEHTIWDSKDTKQIPLKNSEWQQAIDHDFIDKEINVVVVNGMARLKRIADLEPEDFEPVTKRTYTEEEVREMLGEIGELYRNEFSYGSPAFEDWFKNK